MFSDLGKCITGPKENWNRFKPIFYIIIYYYLTATHLILLIEEKRPPRFLRYVRSHLYVQGFTAR